MADLATDLQPTLATALQAEQLEKWGLQWLSSHTGWLLILDNVNDPADIAHLLARAPGGRFLITSRLATAWSDATTLVRLDILEPAESLDLLTHITTATGPRDLDGAADLCAKLLPPAPRDRAGRGVPGAEPAHHPPLLPRRTSPMSGW
ncbi:hypothetical protein ACFVXQ_16175 [Kitasatospora sp. NPDC058263]